MTGWQDGAACVGQTELFFAPPGVAAGDATNFYRAAKAVCAGCPVRAECLDYALANYEIHGVWGGTGPQERRRMLADRPRPRPDVCVRGHAWTPENTYMRPGTSQRVCKRCRLELQREKDERRRRERAA